MLSRTHRLLKKEDFNEVYKSGNFFYFGPVTLAVKPNAVNAARLGIAVGTKFSKKAVDRNRIKRQIRAIIRENLAALTGKVDVVVMIKPKRSALNNKQVITYTSQELQESFLGALKKAKLYKQNK